MPTQSIDLSASTKLATFNGSAVEQINLNGAGIWTKPSSFPDVDSSWYLEKEGTGTLGSIIMSTVGSTIYWGASANNSFSVSNGIAGSNGNVILPIEVSYATVGPFYHTSSQPASQPTHAHISQLTTGGTSDSICGPLIDYINPYPPSFSSYNYNTKWSPAFKVINDSGESFELNPIDAGSYGMQTWGIYSTTLLPAFRTAILSKLSVNKGWKIYSKPVAY